jgi:hypothetical protein
MKKVLLFIGSVIAGMALHSCSEDKLPLYDSGYQALNIAKGTVFGSAEDYPEEYSFNAYFLGGALGDYELAVPVRLQGTIDSLHDRQYRVAVVDSATVGAVNGREFTLPQTQTFRRGHYQDSLRVTFHLSQLSDTFSYRLRLALLPGDDFQAGVPVYQWVDILFTRNLSIAPAFWQNNSKLRKISYHPRKCAVFLEISGLTDPDWVDDGSSVILDYWISLCRQWFLTHEEYDEQGNRIYFN